MGFFLGVREGKGGGWHAVVENGVWEWQVVIYWKCATECDFLNIFHFICLFHKCLGTPFYKTLLLIELQLL